MYNFRLKLKREKSCTKKINRLLNKNIKWKKNIN